MRDLGAYLTVLAGATIPVPIVEPLIDRLQSVALRETDNSRSAFSLTFDAGRADPRVSVDSVLFRSPQLEVGAHVSVVVTTGGRPTTLIDGYLTRVQYSVGGAAGTARVVYTGEDASWLLDREEVTRALPMPDKAQVLAVLAPYAVHGVFPMVSSPDSSEFPMPTERTPVQRGTDLAYLDDVARRNGFVSYAIPGPMPGTSSWYWGPSVRTGAAQPAITVGQVPASNVQSAIDFNLDAHGPVQIRGLSTDRRTGAAVTVRTAPPTRRSLATAPLARTLGNATRVRLPRQAGTSVVSTRARAQAMVDDAADAILATGVLDGARYGAVLRPRGLVGLRGAGHAHDGLWYVRAVEHTLRPGAWTQSFTLARDGYGSTVAAVIP